jgi:uncharacterized protein YcnI
MVNGLDFYPTILNWTGTKKPGEQNLDGSDLSELLHKHPRNPDLVKEKDGKPRNSMVWHFPHGVAQQSTIRLDGWKLIKNWMPDRPEYELYKLHGDSAKQSKGGRKELFRRIKGMEQRVDIEEANNLAEKMPQMTEAMSKELFRRLDAMKASYPYFNPHFSRSLPHKEKVCKALEHGREGQEVWARFEDRGSKVVKGQVVYTLNGGEKSEEWYLSPAEVHGDRLVGTLPQGATHYVFNFVDERNFLVSYPDMLDMKSGGNGRGKTKYSVSAFKSN